ncbi:hypothetical protein [Mycetohabitans endofungorum]|uniref:Uncharacterized protein n=2 Tax=Mycetohabitans TaxID=2571159 RepID=A0A2P5KBB6_9BURK|nr:hypothetical protein [Mycetohabitans endofungorum]PPB84012.1 hypothetical protein B0O95_105196 [Mycetohabitans endofungorum]
MGQRAKKAKARQRASVARILHEHEGELSSFAQMQRHYDELQEILNTVASRLNATARPSPAMREIAKRAAAINKWVASDRRQQVPVRVLGRLGGDVESGVNNWLDRNRLAGREPTAGEFLNINPFSDWSGSINQGWIQGAFDRGHMFRLLTEVPDYLVDAHNNAAQDPTEENINQYKEILSNEKEKWQHRSSVFAKELIACARNGYAIHKDVNGRGSVMPGGRHKLLKEILQKATV